MARFNQLYESLSRSHIGSVYFLRLVTTLPRQYLRHRGFSCPWGSINHQYLFVSVREFFLKRFYIFFYEKWVHLLVCCECRLLEVQLNQWIQDLVPWFDPSDHFPICQVICEQVNIPLGCVLIYPQFLFSRSWLNRSRIFFSSWFEFEIFFQLLLQLLNTHGKKLLVISRGSNTVAVLSFSFHSKNLVFAFAVKLNFLLAHFWDVVAEVVFQIIGRNCASKFLKVYYLHK